MDHPKHWWKEAVIYQIYPCSFQDSNGDGIGDLPGILSRLDMLEMLGVDTLWLTPIYASPHVDNGYDISDYQAVDPRYGSMADLDRLTDAAHQRGMRLMMDLVLNHTSDQHNWFVESRKSRDNPFRDFYIWRDGRAGREPNNWGAHFSRSAWTFDPPTGQYYLHTFSPRQPDLNWANPRMRQALYAMVRWWVRKGIDGFRLDAVSFIAKTAGLPDHPGSGRHIFDRQNMMNGPDLHPYLRELNQQAFRGADIATLGECTDLTLQDAIDLSHPDRRELSMPFLFEHMGAYHTRGKNPLLLKAILSKWQTGLHQQGWLGITFNNHDTPRVVSAFGNETPQFRARSAKLFATLLLTLEGTPVLYQGEEIGMTNARYETLAEYDDLQALDGYRRKVAEGEDHNAALEWVRQTSRDRARSPYQWSAAANAGFTSGRPWLGINPNYPEINLERELSQPGSIFHYYRRLIALRRQTPALVFGQFIPQNAPDELFVFQRVLGKEKVRVVLNLGEQDVVYPCAGKLRIGSVEKPDPQYLLPYEARVYNIPQDPQTGKSGDRQTVSTAENF